MVPHEGFVAFALLCFGVLALIMSSQWVWWDRMPHIVVNLSSWGGP